MTGPSGSDFGAEPPKIAGADLESCSNADWKYSLTVTGIREPLYQQIFFKYTFKSRLVLYKLEVFEWTCLYNFNEAMKMVELKKQKIQSKVHQGHHLVLCNFPVLILFHISELLLSKLSNKKFLKKQSNLLS